MFMTATAHIGEPPIILRGTLRSSLIQAINLYRVLQAYVWLAKEVGPAAYLGNMGRWDAITHDALNAFMTWIGDCLVVG